MNLEQIWGFRTRDDDIDSSSDNSKLNSDGEESVQKEHKFVLLENDHLCDSPRPKDEDFVNSELMKSKSVDNGSEREKYSIKRKADRGSTKRKSKKIDEMGLLDDFRMFTSRILEDFRVERENMFARMKQEIAELVKVKSSPRQKQKRNTNTRAPKTQRKPRAPRKKANQTVSKKTTTDLALTLKVKSCNGEVPATPAIKETQAEASYGHKVSEKQAHNNRAAVDVVELAKPSVKAPVFSHQGLGANIVPDQIVTSSYLTLSSGLSDSSNLECGNLKISGGTADHYLSGIREDEQFSKSFEGSKSRDRFKQHQGPEPSYTDTGFPQHQRRNLKINVGGAHHYFPGIQAEAQFSRSSEGYKSMVHPEQQKQQQGSESSCLGTRFSFPLHQGGNLKINDGGTHHYFVGARREEQISRNFEGSKQQQQQGSEASCILTRFPLQLHQKSDNNCLNHHGQIVPESSFRDNAMLGLKMNGGAMRYDHHIATDNNFSIYPH